MTYYFDIDNTITKTDYSNGVNYEKAVPIIPRIQLINDLYLKNKIVYWTARGTTTGLDYYDLTKKQLEEWGAKYHELILGKPNFDCLVDDKVINSETFFNLKNKKIGIVLNNFIRDYIRRLVDVYGVYTSKDKKTLNKPIEPINPYDLEPSFPLDDDEFGNIYAWLYYGVALEVFGNAQQAKTNLLQRICNFQTKIEDELIILSRETNRTKMATLSFLATNQFDLKKIIFVDDYKEYWDYVDVLITDNPEILKVKPHDKMAIVFANEFNKEFHVENDNFKNFLVINDQEEFFTLPIFTYKPIEESALIHITNDPIEDEDKLEFVEQKPVEGAQAIDLSSGSINLSDLRNNINEKDIVNSD